MMDFKPSAVGLFTLAALWSSVTGLLRPDDKPTLPLLRNFPTKDNRMVDIAEDVSTDCEKLGIQLLEDDHGNIISNIVHSERDHMPSVCSEVFKEWLAGKGRLPVTWETLVRCLRDIQRNILGDMIEDQYDSDPGENDKRSNNINSKGLHEITDVLLLYKATARVGNWEALCFGLGVREGKINELRNSGKEVSNKKLDCLEAYYNSGEAYWEDVVRVVNGYPIRDRRLARRIAERYGVDYDAFADKDEL